MLDRLTNDPDSLLYFANYDELRGHVVAHHPHYPIDSYIICKQCGQVFINRYKLSCHVFNVHSGKRKNYKRPSAAASAAAASLNSNNNNNQNSNNNQHNNSMAASIDSVALRIQLARQQQKLERKYGCQLCKRAFRRVRDLQMHIQIMHKQLSEQSKQQHIQMAMKEAAENAAASAAAAAAAMAAAHAAHAAQANAAQQQNNQNNNANHFQIKNIARDLKSSFMSNTTNNNNNNNNNTMNLITIGGQQQQLNSQMSYTTIQMTTNNNTNNNNTNTLGASAINGGGNSGGGANDRTCYVCAKTLKVHDKLKSKTYARHMQVHHGLSELGQPLSLCPVCEKGFQGRQQLERHMHTHLEWVMSVNANGNGGSGATCGGDDNDTDVCVVLSFALR